MTSRTEPYGFAGHPMNDRTIFVLGDGYRPPVSHQFQLLSPILSHSCEQHTYCILTKRVRNRAKEVRNGRPQSIFGLVVAKEDSTPGIHSHLEAIRSEEHVARLSLLAVRRHVNGQR